MDFSIFNYLFLYLLSLAIWVFLNWRLIQIKEEKTYFLINYLIPVGILLLTIQQIFSLLGININLYLLIIYSINLLQFDFLSKNWIYPLIIILMLAIDLGFFFL